MEKVKTIEELDCVVKKMVFAFVDALVGKKNLKDALSSVLQDVKSKSGFKPLFDVLNEILIFKIIQPTIINRVKFIHTNKV